MQTNRIVTGVGSGALHEYQWALSIGISDHMISPVAVCGEMIAATATCLRDGSARAVLISGADVVRELESGTYLVAGAPGTFVVGQVGFGDGAFRLTLAGDREEIEVPKGARTVDIDCVNSDGHVGGSIDVRGEECAVIWREGEAEVFPGLRRVTAIGEDGMAFGQDLEGQPVRLENGAVFGGRGAVVAVSQAGDALVNSDNSIVIWKADGGVEALAVRGYVRVTALGWSGDGVVLGFGVTGAGLVQHWLFDPRVGVRVLSGQSLDGGFTLLEIGAIGSRGELAGVATDGVDRFLVRLF